MFKRLLTGILIVAIIVGFTLLRMVHLAFFDVFVLVLMMISAYEFIKANKSQNKTLFERLIFLYPIPVCVGYIFANNIVSALFIQLLSILVIFLISLIIELIIYAVERKTHPPIEPDNLLIVTKNTMSIIIYPLSIISFLFIINHFGQYFGINNIGYILIILTFGVSMVTDTFAYIFGMLFGKNRAKLSPEISPKKSVIGAIMGLVGGLIVGMAGWLMFYQLDILNANLSAYLNMASSLALFSMIGLVGSLATQLGDLVASAVKRKANIKDFSNILPGHGGIMDRIDGEIFCSAVVTILFVMFLIF